MPFRFPFRSHPLPSGGVARVRGPRPFRAALPVALLAIHPASAAGGSCPPHDGTRPAIGLVLAGGGARGGAHVGVLKVLEELRVPVDCVAGTSMGAIVGGLFAAGYSAAEMETVLGRIDWESTFRDLPERRQISFRRKEDDNLALSPLEIGVGPKGLSIPSGIIAGQKIDFIFRSLTLEASNLDSFDRLHVPYRAVAADLLTGDAVILDRGDLALAMRASMSIPGVFTPVELEGRQLVDGGIAMNLPVTIARQMGAERIIAINVGTPPKDVVEDLSSLGVYGQTFAVMGERNVREQLALLQAGDVLITPELEGIGAAGFDKIFVTIEAGEAAARAAGAELRGLSVSEKDYEAYRVRQRRASGLQQPQVRIDAVRIEGAVRTGEEKLRRRMRTRPGDLLDLDRVRADLDRISQAGEFASVQYKVVEEDGRNILVVRAQEKSWGPGYMRFGLGAESNMDGDSDVRLIVNYRQTELNRLGAEWKTNLTIGDPASVFTEFFQPLEPTGFWFVAPSACYERDRDEEFLENGDQEVLRGRRFEGGLDLGVQFRNYGEIRLGVVRGEATVEPVTETDFDPQERDVGGARLRAIYDRVDNVFFPTQGNLTRIDLFLARPSLGADEAFDRLSLRSLQAWTLGHNTFIGGISFGTDFGSDLPFDARFELGGFLNLSGFRTGELRGDVMGLLSLGDYWRIGRLGSIGKLYAGAVAQAGNVWDAVDQASASDLLYSGTLFFGVDNAFAPVYVAYGYAEGGHSQVYLFIGKPFGR